MAPKTTIHFLCRSCGAVQPKWMGKCPDCGSWDALEEYRAPAAAHADRQKGAAAGEVAAPQAVPITDLAQGGAGSAGAGFRLATGISELDRVLGHAGMPEEFAAATTAAAGEAQADPQRSFHRGLVPGSVVLIGGDPGVGKSTLMLQAAHQLARRQQRVLYVSSEESAQQLWLRASRLGLDPKQKLELFVLADTNLARILEQARKVEPAVLVVDSVQMIYKGDLPAAPGSVTQLRSCCQELVYFAKSSGCAVFLVGHVTKQGQLAGPRLLEHLVDTVLYFEGDRYHSHRIVRAIKNRFGTTLEVGLFEMTDAGLKQVLDGSGLLAAEYQPRSGSVVCPVLQGSRCLLVEIQALTATGFLGSAKRKTSGLDGNRLAMLIAVLEKRGGLRLADQDIFASSVGGMKVIEPAADLATAMAIASAHYNKKLAAGVCAIGEIGLGGEIRHVQQMAMRYAEAARLGFTQIICPTRSGKPPKGSQLLPVKSLDQGLELLH